MSFLIVARLVFAALFVLVTYLTVTPNPDDLEAGMAFTRWIAELLFGDAALNDKVAHFLAYAALGASAAAARLKLAGRSIATVGALVFYGGILEGVQALVATRDAELLDALANGLGALAGFSAALLLFQLQAVKARA
ncbi:MAG: VanZ family protein [Parvularculaceae bacterium]